MTGPRRRPRPVRAAAVLVVALLAAAGAAPAAAGPDRVDGATFPPSRPTRVLVLGDSVMKGAATEYAGWLPGREVVVDAEVNRSTRGGVEVLDRLGTDWDVVVVLLGHNDGGSPGAYQPAAVEILDRLSAVRRVSWLTIHEVRPYYPAVNQFIAGQQAARPNLHIADWNAVAAQNPGALAGDGLHLNGAGAALMAELVAQEVGGAELEWSRDLERLYAQTTTTSTTTTTTTAPPTTSTTEAPTTTTTAPTTTDAPTTVAAPTTTAAPAAGGDDGSGPGSSAAAIGAVAAALAGGVAAAVVWLRRRRRGPAEEPAV